ncbi:hypothetical protein J6590_025087 [Homalodisca vitripennis]|nr:hypothetical protein J6590_025087 [Homalodisca vitripennis]
MAYHAVVKFLKIHNRGRSTSPYKNQPLKITWRSSRQNQDGDKLGNTMAACKDRITQWSPIQAAATLDVA